MANNTAHTFDARANDEVVGMKGALGRRVDSVWPVTNATSLDKAKDSGPVSRGTVSAPSASSSGSISKFNDVPWLPAGNTHYKSRKGEAKAHHDSTRQMFIREQQHQAKLMCMRYH